jgi:hypothetical protein
MFDRFKPVPFDPYRGRRSRWRVPRWLVLLLLGVAAGAAGVVYVQEKHLPPRLSADASTRLQADFEQADAERQQLRTRLEETTRSMEAARAESAAAAKELQASRETVERLRKDVATAVAGLPPDPRGGTVEVRAAQLFARGGQLAYDVVLTRDKAGARPVSAVLQITAVGDGARGADTAVAAEPVPISIGGHEVVRGSMPLPAGFAPRQATIRVLDRAGGNSLGMRVMLVK